MYPIRMEHFSDLIPGSGFAKPRNWNLATGTPLSVHLKEGRVGTLTIIDSPEADVDVWRMKWDCPASQHHGRNYEMSPATTTSDFVAMPFRGRQPLPPNTTFPMVIRLLPSGQASG